MVKSKCRGNEIYFNEGDKTWYYKGFKFINIIYNMRRINE